MKVWYDGKYIDMEIGQTVTLCRIGGFSQGLFGESGKLERTTKQHMIFVSESGGVIKTKIDNLHHTVGKAYKEGYFVSLKSTEELNVIYEKVRFWDDKRCVFVKK